MGHALHGLLSQVRFPRLSGTNVARDFVELPSQIYEHWLEEPAVLERFARHYQTGEPIPKPLLRQTAGGAQLRPGLCHGGIPRLGPGRHGFPHPAAAAATPSRRRTRRWRASACRKKSGRAMLHRISPMFSAATVILPAITPISGRKCWMPTVSRHLRKRMIHSIPPPPTGFTNSSIPPAAPAISPLPIAHSAAAIPDVEALLEGRGLAGRLRHEETRGLRAAARHAGVRGRAGAETLHRLDLSSCRWS